MSAFFEILKYILPALIVFITVYYLLKIFFENESKKRLIETKLLNRELVTPIRLQAYERIVLLLERISPENLIMRVYNPNMNAMLLHGTLIKNIREEFEHNLSQQVYISLEAWEKTKEAKEEIIKLINTSFAQVDKTANAEALSKAILENVMKSEKQPATTAINTIKNEVNRIF